ncbi:MAG: hypothetical protein MJ110_07205, partial [Lachnospiraceae bacterium]|nr:hypothetical protein [Lachnospiraceae bacterium]
MEHIDNFEDARIYIEGDIGGIYDFWMKRRIYKQAILFSGIFLIMVLVAAASSNDPSILYLSPMCILLVLPNTLLNLSNQKSRIKSIKSGTYFTLLTPEKVIEQTNRQIDIANEYKNDRQFME